jgi:hypothetical protein
MTKEEQFEAFWKSYPRRVAKGAARKMFDKAIKKTTLDNMLKAITEYVARKPEKIDFKHPATWLNGECWDDEWEPAQAKAPAIKTSADRFQSREDYIAYHAGKNSPEPVNDEMRARLRSAGIGV